MTGSHLPPTIAISGVANAAPPLVTLVPSTTVVAAWARRPPLPPIAPSPWTGTVMVMEEHCAR